MRSSIRTAQVKTAGAIALWAVSFPLIKLALQDVSPVTLIVIRFSLGGLSLFLAAAKKQFWRGIKWADLPSLIILGLVGVTLHQLLQVTGQAASPAGTAAFLASTAPAFIVLFGGIFLKERLGFIQLAGVLLATGGAVIVSTGGLIGWLKGSQLFEPGSVLILASAIVWAFYSILNRYVGSGRPPLVTAGGMMLVGVLFTLPVWITQKGWLELAGLSSITWLNLLVIGLLCTGLAHLLYTQALQRAPASNLAAIQNIEPVIAVLAAVILVGEALHPALISGGVLILAGVYLAEKPDAAIKYG